MDYILEGVGNELLTIILFYFICITVLLKFFKFDPNLIIEQFNRMWQYFCQFFSEENMSMSILGEEVNENSLDQPLDVRIFNTDCCVCLSENCNYPVTSGCGHCFCGTCAMNLMEHNSIPMRCPLCRQECRALFLPLQDLQNSDSSDELRISVVNAIASYNARTENRFPFVNRMRNVPIMFRHLIRSFTAFRGSLVFRLKCHVMLALLVAGCYFFLSTDIIPERIFGLIGFIDDIIVVTLLTVLVARTYTRIEEESSVSFNEFRAALE